MELVPSPLLSLKSMSKDARRAKARELMSSTPTQLNPNGLTLFKFHFLPVIFAEHRALYGIDCTQWYAEIKAGFRWNALNAEQDRYWVYLTAQLLYGNVKPLEQAALDDFLAGKITWLECEQEYGESTALEDYTCKEGIDLTFLRGSGSAVECSSSAVDDGSKGVIRAPCTSVGTFRNLMDEPIDNPITDVFEQHEMPATSASDSCPSCDELGIDEQIAMLKTMPRGTEKTTRFRALRTACLSSGYSLFEHHAKAAAIRRLGPLTAPESYVPSIIGIWHLMDSELRAFWAEQTAKLQSGLDSANETALSHFVTDQTSARSSGYSRTVDEAVRVTKQNFWSSFPTSNTTDSPTPILDLLYGSPSRNIEPEYLIGKVVESIADLGQQGLVPKMVIRQAGLRINYDPKVTGVTSIAVRLHAGISRGLTVKRVHLGVRNVHDHFEWLLRPLMYINGRTAKLFEPHGLNFPADEVKKYSQHTWSCFEWARPELVGLQPVGVANKEEVVGRIMLGLRYYQASLRSISETAVAGPSNAPGVTQKAERWSLADDAEGFGAQLMECFRVDGLESKEYEDLLEQKLYALCRFDRTLLPRYNRPK